MLRRRPSTPPAANQEYATRSGAGHGPADVWPTREADAAARHAQAYNDQKARLDARGATESDPFVATVFAMQRPETGAFTYTTWTEGLATLLPAADVIRFAFQPTAAGDSIRFVAVRWDVVADLVADECWQVAADLVPPRLRTVGWPTPEQLAVLEASALP